MMAYLQHDGQYGWLIVAMVVDLRNGRKHIHYTMFRCSADTSHCEIILNSLTKAVGLLNDIERAINFATYSLLHMYKK